MIDQTILSTYYHDTNSHWEKVVGEQKRQI